MLRFIDTYVVRRRFIGGTDDGIMPFEAVSLFVDDVCIANAVNLSNFESERTQVVVCETCGNVGCGSGGWVHVRTIGEDVLWIPPRKLPAHDEKFDWQDSPPPYFATSAFGIPVFRRTVYDELRAQLPWFPDRNTVPAIRACEALSLLQRGAPLEVLGRAPRVPQLQRERILAVSEGDLNREMDMIDAFSRDCADCETPVQPIDVNAACRPIEFYLDASRLPSWTGFCHLAAGIGIMLEPWRPLQAY
ncbi:MAG TPA: hypothetical protein VGH74_18065 [Planctomycetaceae bacterium]|jgi:hypothetical protein